MSQLPILIISAGAGSGKTYRLTEDMKRLLTPSNLGGEGLPADGIFATTFTNKSAAELEERVRLKLLQNNLYEQADSLANALLGTVHSIGTTLITRFALEAGISPQINVMDQADSNRFFNLALSSVLQDADTQTLLYLSESLGFNSASTDQFDFRAEIKTLMEIAVSNNLGKTELEASKTHSLKTLFELLGEPDTLRTAEGWDNHLIQLLDNTTEELKQIDCATKLGQDLVDEFKKTLNAAKYNHKKLPFNTWAKLSKSKGSKAQKEALTELIEFAEQVSKHPRLFKEIEHYYNLIFKITIQALSAFEKYKRDKRIIDFTDMEVTLLHLLENEQIQEALKAEINLILVDEFQDTNPLQLAIYLKLAKLVGRSIWVGDPKQSIYGFRGAEPRLMLEVMNKAEKTDNLQYSWRSRKDLVNSVNAIFSKAFVNLKPEQIVLQVPEARKHEPTEMGTALHYWHFDTSDEGKPLKSWDNQVLALEIKDLFENPSRQLLLKDKHSGLMRAAEYGDLAILFRSNAECLEMATRLKHLGIHASLAQNGLLETAEAKLVIACIRYLLSREDSLAKAEIMHLAEFKTLQDIVTSRQEYLETRDSKRDLWQKENPLFEVLESLRYEIKNLSCSETINLLLHELELRYLVSSWENNEQRLDNLEVMRALALNYEDSAVRINASATLGGFIIWITKLATEEKDSQGSSNSQHAVNVLTYHKSKGLEWPIVICQNLSKKEQITEFSASIINLSPAIDLDNPLKNRLILKWINPFGKQKQGTAFYNKYLESETATELKKSAAEEETRLLYVGLTRARDYLILPTYASSKHSQDWLSRVCVNDGAAQLLQPDAHLAPWVWDDQDIPMASKICSYPSNPEVPQIKIQNTENLQIVPHTHTAPHPTLYVTPSTEVTTKIGYKLITTLNLPETFEIPLIPKSEQEQLLSAYMSTASPTDTPEISVKKAEETIKRFHLQAFTTSEYLQQYAQAFWQQISQATTTEWKTNQRMKTIIGGQIHEQIIDLAQQTTLTQQLIIHHHEEEHPKHIHSKLNTIAQFILNLAHHLYPNHKQTLYLHASKNGLINVYELS